MLLTGACIAAHAASLPTTFDLRNIDGHSYIGPVRDQGDGGTCYAFAALAAAESTYNRITGLSDGAAADFSESFIAWSLDPLYEGIENIYGADSHYDELQGLVDHGVCTEAAFPYTVTDPGANNLHWDAPRVKFSSWHRLPAYDVETMKRAVAALGAVDVGVLVQGDFADYTSGVYNDYYHAATDAVDYESAGNHRIAIIGWDDAPAEGGDGAWIVRNSWSPSWGEAGQIRMDYHAAGISLMSGYLVYGAWTGEDFATRLTGDLVAGASEAGGIATSYGFYSWGGNRASLVNEANVTASLTRATGDVLTHGLFLWGGDQATLDNRQSVLSRATAADGLAIAYGLCLQGHTLRNSGVVRVQADNTGSTRATAYGARFQSLDSTGTFANSNLIQAEAHGESAWAIGAQIDIASTVENSGDIEAYGTTGSAGLIACGVGEVRNSGLIRARSDSGFSFGISQDGGRLVNLTGARIEAHCNEGGAIGLRANDTDVLNNGTISGDLSQLEDCRLAGSGSFVGDLELTNCRASPGDGGIGSLTIAGDLKSSGSFSMQVEIGRGTFDRLLVNGAATLDGVGGGTAALEIVPVGYAAAGNYTIIAATSASGAFTEVSAPALFEGTVTAGAGGFVLALSRHSYAHFTTRPELAPLGKALDRVGPHATGETAAMLNLIDNYAEGASIGAAVAQLQPAINANASAAALQEVHRTSAHLASYERAYPAGAASGSGTAWFGALDGRERHGAADGFRAIDENTDGGMAGVDYLLGGHFTVGAAIADVRGGLRERTSTDHAHLDAQRGYLHARWDERPGTPGWYASVRLGAGFSRIDTWRRVDFLATEVESSHHAWDGSLALAAGRNFQYRRWTLRPFADAEYVCLTEQAYSERGGSGAALAFAQRREGSLLAGVGVAVSTRFNVGRIALWPEVRVRQERDFMSGTDGLTAAFAGGDTFDSPARRFSRDRTEVGASLRAKLSEKITVAANYSRTAFGHGADFSDTVGFQVQASF